MKNYSYIGISLVILIFGIIFIPRIIDRLNNGSVVQADRLSKPEGSAAKTPASQALAYVEINGKRKKAPAFRLVNQQGDTITNEDYLGKVYVAEFFFTTCPTICPIMNRNLVEIQNEFSGESDFGIASFSIDPQHDTPEVLRKYAGNHGIRHPNWHLLTGDQEQVFRLANGEFNIYAGADDQVPGGFAHQGLFALVDQEGYIRSRRDAYGNPIIYYRGSVERNKSIVEGEEEPQIDVLIEDIHALL